MKKLIAIAALSLISTSSFAATVEGAKLDASGKNVLIDVTYAGGCAKHSFTLKSDGGCGRSMPADCHARLVDHTIDQCEMGIIGTISVPVPAGLLNVGVYKGAYLTIHGDPGQNGKPTRATVRLP